MCSTCNLDEVALSDIPTCIIMSFKELYEEVCQGKFSNKTLMKKDRLYYVIMFCVVILAIRCLCVNKNQKTHEAFWELDARWYP
jgi:hypothetical protein